MRRLEDRTLLIQMQSFEMLQDVAYAFVSLKHLDGQLSTHVARGTVSLEVPLKTTYRSVLIPRRVFV
jgi:hypothetical protein